MSKEVMKLALEALDGGHVDRAYGYIQEALVKGEEHMTELEQKILMWSLGFTVGVMTTIAVDKIVERDVLPPHSEAVRADELISIYKRGVRDALKTNPVSFELEQVCLEVWANKQPVEVK